MSDSLETDSSIGLLLSEKWHLRTRHSARGSSNNYRSAQEIARALLRRPGRYRSPFSWHDRLRLRIASIVPSYDPFSLENHIPQVPLIATPGYEWQALVRYLVREGVLMPPGDGQAFFSHADPKFPVARFLLNIDSDERITGTGSSFNFDTAFSKGIGELLERFFLMSTPVYRPRVVHQVSERRLRHQGVRYLSPERLTQFSSAQYQRSPKLVFDDSTTWSWVKGYEVGRSRPVLIPAQCVSFGRFGVQGKAEPLLRDRNSNAAAGGFTLTEALVSGIHEAIERDGFMICWLNRIAPPVIDVSSCEDEDFQRLLVMVRRYHFEAVFLNITSDIGVPAVTCVLIDRGPKGPSICIGSSCGFHVPTMLKSALFEALSVQRGGESKSETVVLSEAYQPFVDRSIDLSRRVKLWKDPVNFRHIEFFLSGPEQSLAEAFPQARRFSSARAELEYLRERLAACGPGYEIYYYEHRHRILDRLGYHVVKVIIPELVHLYLTESNASLGPKRLRTVPPKLGYETAKEWNPWPHPFP